MRRLLYGGLSGWEWYFPWSSIRVCLLFVSFNSFRSQPVTDRGKFLIQNPFMPSQLGVFHLDIFLMLLWMNQDFFLSPGLFPVLETLFFMLFIHSVFVMISTFPYLSPKLFCLSRIRLWVCPHTFFPYMV